MRTRQATREEDDLEDVDIDALLGEAAGRLAEAAKPADGFWRNLPKLDAALPAPTLVKRDGTVVATTAPPAAAAVVPRPVVDPVQVRKAEREKAESTAGAKWFDMPKTEVTPQIKRDLQLLKLRNVLDPKRHYRREDKAMPEFFQPGTIVEGATEFFSARLSKKERKQTLAEEILADSKAKAYFKRKYAEIQKAKTSGGRNHARRMHKQRSRR
ncbi:Fcf2 pre-rRNA processing-domain-containing protein [Dipodascopsis tothii]|uniref:Fcf2 pre-rRNA processing-domain-containing protein n=1 Tax=Dipodascopsis tothii TaxID=44089 RepID=UPI0034CE22FE